MPGREKQATGQAAETAAAASTAGYIGWSPEANRAAYKVGSAVKGPVETDTAAGKPAPQFYR